MDCLAFPELDIFINRLAKHLSGWHNTYTEILKLLIVCSDYSVVDYCLAYDLFKILSLTYPQFNHDFHLTTKLFGCFFFSFFFSCSITLDNLYGNACLPNLFDFFFAFSIKVYPEFELLEMIGIQLLRTKKINHFISVSLF